MEVVGVMRDAKAVTLSEGLFHCSAFAINS